MTKTSPLLRRENYLAYKVPVSEERVGERVVQWLARLTRMQKTSVLCTPKVALFLHHTNHINFPCEVKSIFFAIGRKRLVHNPIAYNALV